MASEKACYWLALAILMVGMGGKFANRAGDWAQSVVRVPLQRAELIADHITGHRDAAVRRFDRHSNTARVLVEVKTAQMQARMACANAAIDRRAAAHLNEAMARLNARMAQLQAQQAWQ
jgi:hypothetical protein